MKYRDVNSAALSLLAVAMIACVPNQRIVNSSAETPVPVPVNAAPLVSNFDSDLQAMRNADFKFILVFRRKDGGVLTPDDKAFANANGPYKAALNKASKSAAEQGRGLVWWQKSEVAISTRRGSCPGVTPCAERRPVMPTRTLSWRNHGTKASPPPATDCT